MTGEHAHTHRVASGSCYAGLRASATLSPAAELPRRRACAHRASTSAREISRARRPKRAAASESVKRPQRSHSCQSCQSWQPNGEVRPRRGTSMRLEDVMAQALRREALRPESAMPPTHSSTACSMASAVGASPGGARTPGARTPDDRATQRLQHAHTPSVLPSSPRGHGGAPLRRPQSWDPSDRPPSKRRPGPENSVDRRSGRQVEEELSSIGEGTNVMRVEALQLKMRRWQLTYERQQGVLPSELDTAARRHVTLCNPACKAMSSCVTM